MNETLQYFLDQTSRLHRHLCPRQVLGVRMGMAAAKLLNLNLPQTDKRLLVIIETDGCAADGVSVSSGCTVGHRTLRVEDYGKVAATFYDTQEMTGYRIAPRQNIRELADHYSPPGSSKWEKYLLGYQRMPDPLLFSIVTVELNVPVQKLISRPGVRTLCGKCGEEIMNEREVLLDNVSFCRSCAGDSYYTVLSTSDACEAEACGHL
jgi:formylmethanofuran dehydrogenase subunit E